ncbi:MAG TPA: alkaline phosphatase family protein [Candidatus Acidoferrum sp.]|nr:alkaline phosphatase family protein [Candidatus Acidoferrum sp.]
MIRKNLRWMAAVLLAVNLAVVTPNSLMAQPPNNNARNAESFPTTTPIKHVVVIFQENVSFDHYFGTYPNSDAIAGEPQFHARKDTPAVNGLTAGLLAANPNQPYPPIRLDRSENYTCDQNHDYTPEQQAFDSGLMDKFPEFTATPCSAKTYPNLAPLGPGIVMGYYDGATVTALWNYAQHFSLDDNFFGTTFGPSTPGALNVTSGFTGDADLGHSIDDGSGDLENDVVDGSVIGDADPYYDDCGSPDQTSLTGKNIGDLLNQRNVSWGWFQGGFTPSAIVAGKAQCSTTTNRLDGTPETAYSAHHNPFEYYASTANIHHTPPASLSEIGHAGPANHLYDLSYFWKALANGQLPAVTYLKANRAQDGHPNNSSPLDEQQFVVTVLNALQASPVWDSTAVFITWDDSDGWYDHVMGPIVNQSVSKADGLTGVGACGTGANSLGGMQARCGYGPRIPCLVISPYAKDNFVDGTLTDFSSIVRFIEDNWDLDRIGPGSFDQIAGPLTNMFDFTNKRSDRLFLDPLTGEVLASFKH